MGFYRQEYWNELLCPLPGDLPDPEIKPGPLTSPALGGKFITTIATWEAHLYLYICIYIQPTHWKRP